MNFFPIPPGRYEAQISDCRPLGSGKKALWVLNLSVPPADPLQWEPRGVVDILDFTEDGREKREAFLRAVGATEDTPPEAVRFKRVLIDTENAERVLFAGEKRTETVVTAYHADPQIRRVK